MGKYFHIARGCLVDDIQQIETFTDSEAKMILAFRKADKTTQEMIRRMLAYSEGMSNDNR